MHSIELRRRAILRAAVVASLGIVPALAAAQTSGTWNADANSSWSIASKWNGSVPNGGGTATFVELPSFISAPITVSQDVPGLSLSLIDYKTLFTFTIARPTGNTTNTITLVGDGELRHEVNNIVGYGTTSANGQTISIPLAGAVGVHKTGAGVVSLSATNTFTGDVRIDQGTLRLGSTDVALGNAANNVFINNATLRNGVTWTTARTITLTNTGTLETFSAATLNGKVTGTGNFVKSGSSVGTFTANNDYSGSTSVGAGSLVLTSNGQLSATTTILAGATITLDNTSINNTNRLNDSAPVTFTGSGLSMIGNTAGSSETIGATTIGKSLTGITVTPTAAAGATITSPSLSRTDGGAVFYRGTNLGQAPGANTANIYYNAAPTLVGAGGGAGSTTQSIIPFAYAIDNAAAINSASTVSLATYGANGIRPLNIGNEYVSTIAAATGNDNVRIIASEAVNSPTAVNALVIGSGGGVSGSALLTVNSGVILTPGTATISAPLNFGASEGILQTPGNLTLAGPISGSGGLTKASLGNATFSGASSYTGTTIIGAGTNYFTASVPSGTASPFGADTSAVTLAGGDFNYADLFYAGTTPATFNRPLRANSTNALFNTALVSDFGTSTATTLTMNGAIQMDSPLTASPAVGGTLVLNGKISGNAASPLIGSGNGTVVMNNPDNDYQGGTEMSLETWQLGADHPFGPGVIKILPPALSPGGPTFIATGGPRTIPNTVYTLSGGNQNSTFWTINGSQDITFSGTIGLSDFGSPNGAEIHQINNTGVTTYSGRLTLGGLTKAGNGLLYLSGNSDYNAATIISAGVLRIGSNTALGQTVVGTTVSPGATLELTNNALSSEPVTISGAGVALGALRSLSGSNTLGAVTLAAASTICVDTGSTLRVGNVGGTFDLTKVGAGVLSADRYRIGSATITTGTAAVTAGRSATLKLSTTNTLTIAGGSTPTASLDLNDNDLQSTGTTAPALASLVAYARDGGLWDRGGITSSVAKNQIPAAHTLGVLSGADYSSVNPSAFDGVTPTSTDGLVRYTYYGDTDFDDAITATDISRLNNGFTNGLSGWLNGDVDNSGAVDYVDFARTDVAYTSQDATINRAIAYLNGTNTDTTGFSSSPSLSDVQSNYARFGQGYADVFLGAAVPEPTSVSAIVIGLAMLKRRRRN